MIVQPCYSDTIKWCAALVTPKQRGFVVIVVLSNVYVALVKWVLLWEGRILNLTFWIGERSMYCVTKLVYGMYV